MNYQTVAPSATPISVTEAKAHCRIDSDDEDTAIGVLISAAVTSAQSHLSEQLCTATRVETLDSWPIVFRPVNLAYSPVQSISSIKYYDTDGDLQTLDSGEYIAGVLGRPGWWQLTDDATLPDVYDRPDAIQVTYVCGYGDAADVPAAIKLALLQMVHDWYTDRSAVGMPTAAALSLLAAAGHGAYTI